MAEQRLISDVASSFNTSKKYDVFLSFRGEDTRRNFISHFYEALKQKKVETYIDEHLEKGDEISPALIKAIEDSHVSIVVFSENYASSKWCLGELIKILQCKKDRGQIVIPVFYNIDPSYVRKQTGSYEQAFAKHEGEPNCNKWKTALTEAANLAGWDSRTYSTDLELLKDIVGYVLQKLLRRYQSQCKGLVGIQEHYKQIRSLLKLGRSEVRTLGIRGMGGIGKTTLVVALFDNLSHEFEGSCFLANVREKVDKLKNPSFHESGIRSLRDKRSLVVLDDVDTSEQLEKLIVDYDLLGPGSRVIVTTRNKQVLSRIDEIYQVEELRSDLSLQLFCLAVFGEKQPRNGYEDLSERVISYCKGIPLALKVLGASLRQRSKDVWESELRKLQKIPNIEIHKVLKLSYDGLDHSQKEIFLDIACFFKGENRDWVTRLLEAFDFFATSGIEALLDKALITISDGNQIEMHDLIREMGREIVHQECIKDPGRRSRLWRHEEVHDVLKHNRGTDVVEGMILDLTKLNGDLCLSTDGLTKMSNVRFLRFLGHWACNFDICFPNGLESLPDKLSYLEWNRFCLESLPPKFCAEQLVELHMHYSKLKKLWDGVQNLVNLKTIDLDYSWDLIEIPDLSKADKLEIVSLRGCARLCQLHVHSKSLQGLIAQCCSSLEEFPVTSKEIIKLNLAHTKICSLPSSIWQKKKLTFLSLRGCDNLEFVGNNIVHLASLEELDLSGISFKSLPTLPSSLQLLMANNCTSLETDFTQQLVLQHMLHIRIPYLHQQYLNNHMYIDGGACFFFPGDHVSNECGFFTADSSITIPYLPKSDLCGFIYCIIISKGLSIFDNEVSFSVYLDGIKVCWSSKKIDFANLISDHVLFWHHDVRQFDKISEVYDHFKNITFVFEHECSFGTKRMIKECGVFPIYVTTQGFKLISCNSNEIFEWESRGTRVGCSNDENEKDREQLLSSTKRMRTSP